MESKLLTLVETRKVLGGISAPTLRKLERAGRIRPVLIGRRRFFSVQEIQKFVDQGEERPAPQRDLVEQPE